MKNQKLISLAKFFLIIVPLTPLIVARDLEMPFIIGKAIFARTVIELALLCLLIAILTRKETLHELIARARVLIKNPLMLAVAAFILSALISTALALSPERAFWGTLERGEGLFMLLHYGMFLILTTLLLTRKDWQRLCITAVTAGAILIFYGLLQYIGVERFPFALTPKPRPQSFIGNTAMFGTYLLLITALAALMPKKAAEHKTAIPVTIGILSIVMIMLTQARGAMIGVAVGIVALLVYYAYKKIPPRLDTHRILRHRRTISGALLLLAIIGMMTFAMTRGSAVWQKIPGLNRLAQTELGSTGDSSTQTRLITWGISWEAFKERPIVGWGPGNYNFAWQRYYNPELATYGETWLDRAHNKILGVMTTQGILGIASYTAIIITLAYLMRRKENTEASISTPIAAAAIVAYMVSIMFLFDDPSSHVVLFTILGLVIWRTTNAHEETHTIVPTKKFTGTILRTLTIPAIIVIIYSLYSYNHIPYVQAKLARDAKRPDDDVSRTIQRLTNVFEPYTYIQPSVRGAIIDHYYKKDKRVFEDPKFTEVYTLILDALEETIERETYSDARMFIRKNWMLNAHAAVDPTLREEAVRAIEMGLKHTPKRQELYYLLSRTYGSAGEQEKAEEAAREAVALNPDVARAQFNLGLVIALGGDETKRAIAQQAFEKTEALDPTFRTLLGGDPEYLAAIYASWGDMKKIGELTLRDVAGGTKREFERRYFELALKYFADEKDVESLTIIAMTLGERNPELREGMEILLRLAQEGRWDMIEIVEE